MTRDALSPLVLDEAFITVVIPCRNERRYITTCLTSLRDGTWPAERLEVLVVDGMSDDGTVEEVLRFSNEWSVVRLLQNPCQIVPSALNIGIRAARGNVIVRIDAHSEYPERYLEALVTQLLATGADNVGGVCRTVPGGDGPEARGIASAMSHPLAVGNAQFRIGAKNAGWVDTVPFGCFRRDVFDRVGLFDEEMVRNQDDEFNHRLLKSGGRIRLVPEIEVVYYARDSFRKLARMMFQYGLFKPLACWKVRRVSTVRQLVPPAFVSSIAVGAFSSIFSPLAGLALLLMLLVYSGALGLATLLRPEQRNARVSLCFAMAVAIIHVSYGVGYLAGVWKLTMRILRGRTMDERNVALTR